MTPLRNGARSISEIPKEVLFALNRGEIASANLVEWLAVDQLQLLEHLLEQSDAQHWLADIKAQVIQLKKPSVNSIGLAIGEAFIQRAQVDNQTRFLNTLASHPSDTVRIWMAYATSRTPELTLNERLQRMRPFAADPHFGVREISWMAARPYIAADVETAIALLEPWVHNANEAIRRFATEATRPRGVWCAHIDILKVAPELALPLLNPLVEDPSKYVRDSVANWLNDASKTRPDFVMGLCAEWQQRFTSKEAEYTCRRAMRTLNKVAK